MGSKGFIRRILPFFATFAVGVFIASFFVSIGPKRGWGERGRCRGEVERLRAEKIELQNEVFRLQNQIETKNWAHHPESDVQSGLEMDFDAPPPPAPPRLRHR